MTTRPQPSPYSNVGKPTRRCDSVDVKELLMKEMRKPDSEIGYNRFGLSEGLPAGAMVQSSSGKSQSGPPQVSSGPTPQVQIVNTPPVVTVLPNGGLLKNEGILDTYFHCDSRFKDPSSNITNGELIFSVIQLNNGKSISNIIEMELGDFYIPVVDDFPAELPVPQRFFFRRSTILLNELSTQSFNGANNSRHHWEVEIEPSGIANRVRLVNSKFIFAKPARDVANMTFQFRTPSGPIPFPQDTFAVIPLRNTSPPRFLMVTTPTINAYRYLVAPTAPSVSLTAASGNLSTGNYRWLVTFVTYSDDGIAAAAEIGETSAGTPSVTVVAGAGDRGNLTNIKLDTWSPTTQVYPLNPINQRTLTRRRIYRTLANGSVFYRVTEIADNVTTSYSDTSSDATISANVVAPTANTSGGSGASVVPHGLALTRALAPPTAPVAALVSGGGDLSASNIGQYKWLVTFINARGETVAGDSTTSTFATVAGDSALLTNIPIGDPGTLARNIYRTSVAGLTYKFAFVINNNTDTTGVDTVADSALQAGPPTNNNSGGQQYTVYLTNLDLSNGTLNSSINTTRGHLATVVDPNVLELTYTTASGIPDITHPPTLSPVVAPGGAAMALSAITGRPTILGSLNVGYRRIAFPIRFRSLVGEETNKITPV